MKNPVKSQILIIFGASGDLTKRKLVPALFELYKQKLLPEKFAVLGVSRTKFSDDDFRERMKSFLTKKTDQQSFIKEFLSKLYYQPLATEDTNEYPVLKDRLNSLSGQYNMEKNYIFYLSTPPRLYGKIPVSLSSVGLNNQKEGFRRLIIEKPFGTDLSSARQLDKQLLENFKEEQIYRIDHYLGKESVQNMLVTRFANGIFEPIWNQNYIHHVEITSAEELGVELRGGYYDNAGAMRDMVQNHLMQLLGMVAMESPVIISADAIRNETMKVLQSLRPLKEEDVFKNVIRGQYIESHIGKRIIKGYRNEKDVSPDSRTETFFAIKAYVDNWRWSGVPFYIRTGKRLPTMVTEVVITFKETPHHLFKEIDSCCN
ncbi:MAG: glucose-6-phosphate dehydrogenase, partial [Prolixibacteraceae bacterium]|nr:glucose-6-phosphate dehydrogenase [Prolixibacteraceae bacterium]